MPRSKRAHLAEAHTVGPVTLDELAALVDLARRLAIPGTTVASVAQGPVGPVVMFRHDIDLDRRPRPSGGSAEYLSGAAPALPAPPVGRPPWDSDATRVIPAVKP